MKQKLIVAVVGVILFVLGMFSGSVLQYAKTEYHYKLLERKEYDSSLGPIEWSCFSESVGTPFLDPEKTMINLGNRTIYKAQRDFQENEPHARNIAISNNIISWEDGDYHYRLTVEPMTNESAHTSSK